MKSLSRVQLLGTPWTAAYQALLPMGFSRQEYWSGVPLLSLKTGWWQFILSHIGKETIRKFILEIAHLLNFHTLRMYLFHNFTSFLW